MSERKEEYFGVRVYMMLPWIDEVAAVEAWIIPACAEQEACSCGCCHGLSPMQTPPSINQLYKLDISSQPAQEAAPAPVLHI